VLGRIGYWLNQKRSFQEKDKIFFYCSKRGYVKIFIIIKICTNIIIFIKWRDKISIQKERG
jgi:predicted RNA-binding protein with PUA-like domain